LTSINSISRISNVWLIILITARILILKTMSTEKEIFRGLQINVYHDLNCIEVMVDETNFHDNASGIFSINNVVEFALNRSNKYLIYNKLNSYFEVDPKLSGYIRDMIIKQLQLAGIRKMIFIVDKLRYEENYKKLDAASSYIIGFTSLEMAIEWIKEDSKDSVTL